MMILVYWCHHFVRKRCRTLGVAGGIIAAVWLWNGSSYTGDDAGTKERDTCRYGLLQGNGRLLPGDTWAPTSCTLHYYSAPEITQCLSQRLRANRTNKFLFMGDSMLRHKARTLMQMIGMADPEGLSNGTTWVIENSLATVGAFLNEMLFKRRVDEDPSVFIFGSNLWFNLPFDKFPAHRRSISLGNISLSDMVDIYKERLRTWAGRVSKWARTERLIWYMQDPVYPGFKNVTNQGVSMYNRIAEEVLIKEFPGIWIWSSARKMTEKLIVEGNEELREVDDFVHLKPPVIRKQMQILMNYLCNSFLPKAAIVRKNYCCGYYPSATKI